MKGDPMLSKNRVKVFLQQSGMRVGNGVYEALNGKMKALLLDAVKRAEKNKRSTVMPHDL